MGISLEFNKVHYDACLRGVLNKRLLMKFRDWSEYDKQEILSEGKECFGLILMVFQRVAWTICEIFCKGITWGQLS